MRKTSRSVTQQRAMLVEAREGSKRSIMLANRYMAVFSAVFWVGPINHLNLQVVHAEGDSCSQLLHIVYN